MVTKRDLPKIFGQTRSSRKRQSVEFHQAPKKTQKNAIPKKPEKNRKKKVWKAKYPMDYPFHYLVQLPWSFRYRKFFRPYFSRRFLRQSKKNEGKTRPPLEVAVPRPLPYDTKDSFYLQAVKPSLPRQAPKPTRPRIPCITRRFSRGGLSRYRVAILGASAIHRLVKKVKKRIRAKGDEDCNLVKFPSQSDSEDEQQVPVTPRKV